MMSLGASEDLRNVQERGIQIPFEYRGNVDSNAASFIEDRVGDTDALSILA